MAASAPIVFIFGVTAIGALLRWMLKNTAAPYTVTLMVVGLGLGFLSKDIATMAPYTSVATMVCLHA